MASQAAIFVDYYTCSELTMEIRIRKCNTRIQFCEEDGHKPLPVTETHFVAFIGWIMMERGHEGNQISSASVNKYMKDVLIIQLKIKRIEVEY